MTKEEMEEIKEYAEATGMFDSKAKGGLTEPDYFKPSAGTYLSFICFSLSRVVNT